MIFHIPDGVQCGSAIYALNSSIFNRTIPCRYVNPEVEYEFSAALAYSVFLGMFGADRYRILAASQPSTGPYIFFLCIIYQTCINTHTLSLSLSWKLSLPLLVDRIFCLQVLFGVPCVGSL